MERWVMCTLVVLATMSMALQVQPSTVTVQGGQDTTFSEVFTVINDESRPVQLSIVPTSHSAYLAGTADIAPQSLSLLPQESGNIQVRGTVPALGPEVHRLQYALRTANGDQLGTFTLRMPIEGTARLHPQIDLDVQDTQVGELVVVDAMLSNFGNVIAYYNLSLVIRELGSVLGTVHYPEAVQVLPGQQDSITLLFTQPLDPGEYSVEVSGTVNEDAKVRATKPLRVLIESAGKVLVTGEDLVLQIKTYGDIPEVTYVLSQNNRELLRDTVYADSSEVVVPTATLSAGEYIVEVRVAHARGVDTSEIAISIQNQSFPLRTLAVTLFGAILLSVFISRRVRLELRMARLHIRILLKERQLNMLLRKAHRLEYT